jgi:1-deoxy-D-xylulose-5-phosphate reductoisomerase
MQTPAMRLDLAEIGSLTFEAPDTDKFPALRIAREALKKGGNAPTSLNAANEVAVAAFFDGRIGFLDIVAIVEKTLEMTPSSGLGTIGDVLNTDTVAREIATGLL